MKYFFIVHIDQFELACGFFQPMFFNKLSIDNKFCLQLDYEKLELVYEFEGLDKIKWY